MFDVSRLRTTIVPKSDQLNSEQLMAGPMTINITEVRTGNAEQPVIINYEGDEGRPYKPCKTMRKVLIFAWGDDGMTWPGKFMTLYCDESVRFGGSQVGGIRISHLSDIDREMSLSLTATKGKKSVHTIKRLVIDHAANISQAPDVASLKAAFKAAYRGAADDTGKAAFKAAYDTRLAELTKQPEQAA
jgi:hypothetical protein